MSDSNQIIERLHKQADSQLMRDLNELFVAIGKFASDRGRNPYDAVKVDDKGYSVSTQAHWLCFTLLQAACRDKVREKAVDNFMARVTKLGDELDEIRAIAEQAQQQ